jgi:hypothetical protein
MLPYKNKIDFELNKLHNINKIYGGQTKKLLSVRKKEHIIENPNNFKGMKIKLLYKNTNENDEKYINDAETYLIKKLKSTYGEKCINKIFTGGSGHQHNNKDIHKIYIMYK